MQENRFAALATQESDSIIYIIDHTNYNVLYLNPQAKHVYHLDDSVLSSNHKCYKIFHGSDVPCAACQKNMTTYNQFHHWRNYNSQLHLFYDIRSKLIDFEGMSCCLCICDSIGVQTAQFAMHADATQSTDYLQKLSFEDLMTGLFNRNYYTMLVQNLTIEPPSTLGIIYLDLNELKYINDTLGHQQGDLLITRTAANMKAVFNQSSIRIGGDEFIIILPDITQAVFQQQLEELRARMQNDHIRISIGTSWRGTNVAISEQIAEAEYAMYLDKESFYKDKLNNSK